MYLLAVGVSTSSVKLATVFGLYGQVCANEEAIVPSTDSFVRRDKAPTGLGSCGQEVAMFVLASPRRSAPAVCWSENAPGSSHKTLTLRINGSHSVLFKPCLFISSFPLISSLS